jgi:hypothetical protein
MQVHLGAKDDQRQIFSARLKPKRHHYSYSIVPAENVKKESECGKFALATADLNLSLKARTRPKAALRIRGLRLRIIAGPYAWTANFTLYREIPTGQFDVRILRSREQRSSDQLQLVALG